MKGYTTMSKVKNYYMDEAEKTVDKILAKLSLIHI